jgi:hypothetical protein
MGKYISFLSRTFFNLLVTSNTTFRRSHVGG